jgi:tetratricopeptide (TPR) repeat protein
VAELPKEPVARGKAALERGQLNEAVKALLKANAVEPDNHEVIRLLAQAYRRQGRYSEAIDRYEFLTKQADVRGDDWLELGHLRFALSDYSDALLAYESARKLEVLDASGRIRRAMSAIYLDKAPLALKWLKEDAETLKSEPAFYLTLARTHVALSQPDAAISAYQLAEKSNPVNPVPSSEAGAVYEALGFNRRALKAYERALSKSKEHHPTLIRYGRLLIAEGKALDAIPILERAKRVSPDSAVVLSHLGIAFSTVGMLKEASDTLREAIKLEPNRSELHSSYAEALYRRGELAKAETSLRESLRLRPERTVDQNALKQIVLVRELARAQCEGVRETQAIKSRLTTRWKTEKWSTESLQRRLTSVMADTEAMVLLDGVIRDCLASKNGGRPKTD